MDIGGTWAADLRRARTRWPLVTAVGALSLIPVLRAVEIVRSSSKFQYGDYWPMLDGMLTEQGGWSLRDILAARNEHPIAIPKLLYAANVELFGGSNHTLGYIVVLIVAIQVGLIGWLALRTDGFSRWSVATVTVTTSVLLFAPQGAWNFMKAMSGAAWLTANLFVLAALVAQRADRRFLTPVLGVMATLSYGTGLAVWPALVLVAALRHRRSVMREWPTLAAGLVSVTSYLIWYSARPKSPFTRPSIVNQARNVLEALGSVVTTGRASAAFGALALVGVLVCSVLQARRRSALPWIGLGAYALAACALISLARYGPNADFNASRYTSLSALTWVAFVALLLGILPARWWVALLPLPLVATVLVSGHGAIEAEKVLVPSQDLRAIALRLRLPIADPGVFGEPFPDIGERLEAAGHFPFSDAFGADCGKLGQQVPVGAAVPEGFSGSVRAEVGKPAYPTAVSYSGTLRPGGHTVECVVVLDKANTVIGAGTLAPGPVGDEVVFATLAPEGAVQRVYVRLSGNEEFVPLEDPSGVTG